jgi:hypothetical protein
MSSITVFCFEECSMNARSRRINPFVAAGAGATALALVGAGLYLSGGNAESAGVDLTASLSAAESVSVSCPDVAGQIGDIPAAAQAGVSTELANLERQISNVNARLAREPGQAESQLNDLAGKRGAVIDRIILDITRVGGTEPAGLRGLIQCSLGAGDTGGGVADPAPPVDEVEAPPADGGAEAPPADGGAEAPPAGGGEGGAVGAQTVDCPTVEDKLPAVPAGAQAEVDRNLTLLQTQIDEADARLARLAVNPEGGPNFVQNAIVGPLEDKRFAVLNRIATAIERITKDRPAELADLALCGLNT